MKPKIPKLKSRYVPVHSNTYVISSEIHWWKKTSPFVYPNVLINLITCTKEQIEKLREDMDGEELFLLTDSGGFQVISGTCNLDWESSLLKQIELGASKIFSFDKPPVEQAFQGSLNQFTTMGNDKIISIIEDNLKVALKQSEYLQKNYPDEHKKFCYIIHGNNYDQFDYNLRLFEKYDIDVNKTFPGGFVYAANKNPDLLLTAMIARHAYENFIKKGIYVHFLGMGSFNKMIILIRNEISTFDSSSILQGARANEFTNPINLNNSFQIPSENIIFTKQWCNCPVCSNVDYHKLIEEGKKTMIGRHFIAHNLWHLLQINTFLDAIPKERYTEIVTNNFKIKEEVKRALNYCDDCDKMGFDVAYEKYKHYLKKDKTKQQGLDEFSSNQTEEKKEIVKEKIIEKTIFKNEDVIAEEEKEEKKDVDTKWRL